MIEKGQILVGWGFVVDITRWVVTKAKGSVPFPYNSGIGIARKLIEGKLGVTPKVSRYA